MVEFFAGALALVFLALIALLVALVFAKIMRVNLDTSTSAVPYIAGLVTFFGPIVVVAIIYVIDKIK